MIVSSKKFMTQLVESIGRMTAMCFEDGVKADKEVMRELGQMRGALWEIRNTLFGIKNILEDAAKENEPKAMEVVPQEEIPKIKIPFDGVGDDKLYDVKPREQKVRKKETKARETPPQPGMKQLQSWAKKFGRKQRDFCWAMKMLQMPRRNSRRDKALQYCWLTELEARQINEMLKYSR